jgi:molybdopterin-containing oxidoreductase family iron-sulfur binding subunit
MVRSYDGRPTKIEGHVGHPAGNGTDAYGQASIIDLYDPDRSKIPLKGGKQSSLKAFEAWTKSHFTALEGQAGKGLAVLAEFNASPSVTAMRAKLAERFPEAQWVEYDAMSRDNEREGLKLAFGQAVEPTYDITKANVIVLLDSDVFTNHPARLQLARDWGKGRNPESGVMNRTYTIESV